MSSEIDQIKETAGAYKKWALEARKAYVSLRLRQDPEIRALYTKIVQSLARDLRKMPTYLQKRHLQMIDQILKEQAGLLTAGITEKLTRYIEEAVAAGGGYSKTITLDLLRRAEFSAPGINAMYARVNLQAVEACWARTKNGLYLSDRVWQQGENYRNTIRDIIQESVAIGQDAVKTARMLEQYVRTDAKTLAKDYPNMMKRMGSRIPGNVSYEALRLARTEVTAAFGEGTIAAARVSPSYKGMKWVLSLSHPVADICDVRAAHDEGLGKGIYSPGNEPPFPAHPNELCHLVPVHEQPDDFVARLKKWVNDPGSEPGLERWHTDVYQNLVKVDKMAV